VVGSAGAERVHLHMNNNELNASGHNSVARLSVDTRSRVDKQQQQKKKKNVLYCQFSRQRKRDPRLLHASHAVKREFGDVLIVFFLFLQGAAHFR
jgi:hypothetical protein